MKRGARGDAALGPDAGSRRAVLEIVRKETVDLLRDRRAVFFSFVLPLVLYPAIFLGLGALPRAHKEELSQRQLRIGVAGEAELMARHLTPSDRLDLVAADPEDADLRDGAVALGVRLDLKEGDEGAGASELGLRATVRYVATSPASVEALKRLRGVLARLEGSLVEARLGARGLNVRLDSLQAVTLRDLSSAAEKGAAGLGRLLPALLLLILLAGGAFAATDLLAGEKERGTLETLCVQPVSKRSIALGKLLVVIASSLASVALNLAGLGAAVWLGITPQGWDGAPLHLPPFGAFLLVLVLVVPLAVLTSAVLLAVSAFSRSYREAQMYLLPLTLVSLLPLALAAAPEVSLGSVVAVVPVANVALAIREAVTGSLEILPLAVVLLTSAFYGRLALAGAASLLEREDVVLSLDRAPLAKAGDADSRGRRALAFGAVVILLLFFAGGWLQGGTAVSLPLGLALTLWGLVLGLALGFARWTRRGMAEALGIQRTAATNFLLSPAIAGAALVLVAAYLRVQESFLPLPKELEEVFREALGVEKLGVSLTVFLLALSPGICEELLWRGAVQGELEMIRRPWRTVVWVGVLFGLFHLSVHRFVPTALLGCLLARLRQRTGSVLPCMVVHCLYNAGAILVLPALFDEHGEELASLPVVTGAALVLWLAWRGLRRRAGA